MSVRLSIATKIFLSYVLVLGLFAASSAYSLVRLRRVGEDLRVLNRVYLRLNEAYVNLNLTLTEVVTLQNNLVNLLDSMADARNPTLVIRWIGMARAYRVRRTKTAAGLARAALRLNPPGRDREFLEHVVEQAELLLRRYRETDESYESLFKALDASRRHGLPEAEVHVVLRRREHAIFTRLRRVNAELKQRLSRVLVPTVLRTANRLEVTEAWTFYATAALVTVAALVALGMAWASQRMLRPLAELARQARRVGQGDYEVAVRSQGHDEIAALAREFETMARALREREQRLIETERLAARSERLAAMGKMAAQITHEIRNPLSSISLNTELLEEELAQAGLDDTEIRHLLHRIAREVDRLTEITEEYLSFARLPAPRLEPTDPVRLLRDVYDTYRLEVEAQGISLELDVPDTLPEVPMDENQIRRAIGNLLRNAREAMGSTPGKIVLGAGLRGEYLEIRVQDEGPGLPTELRDQIFEPFVSTKERGTGLGLAITQQILAEHGGRVEAEDNEGPGACFRLLVPLHPRKPASGPDGPGPAGGSGQ